MGPATEEGKLTAWERWELGSFDAPANKPPPQGSEPAAAPAVRLPTAEEIERIHQQAQQEGYQAGLQAGQQSGLQAGYAEGRAQALAEAERIGNLAARLEEALSGLDAGVADELLALALEIARQVVRSELVAQPESLLNVVREALAQLPHQHAAIYLNPEDASLVRSYLGDQLSHAGHRIHEDPKLARGDCVIEAGGSQIDASAATRWRRVIEGLGLEDAWTPPAPKP